MHTHNYLISAVDEYSGFPQILFGVNLLQSVGSALVKEVNASCVYKQSRTC